MDILISAVLLVIAVAMVFNKPLRIEVHHKYDPADIIQPGADQKDLDKDEQVSPDDIVAAINQIVMGVDIDDRTRN